MKIGILQTGHPAPAFVERSGDYARLTERLLADRGLTFRTWNVVDMDFPDGPEAADGWMITGSPHGAYEDLPFIAPLEEFIRAVRASGRPLVGICFGHQIVAQALGGEVVKAPVGWQVGLKTYDLLGTPVRLHAWHQDQVTRAPEGAEIIATHPDCPIAGLALGGSILTIQGHPEFDRAEVDTLLEVRAPGVVPPDRIAAARESLRDAAENAHLADRIAAFYHVAHG